MMKIMTNYDENKKILYLRLKSSYKHISVNIDAYY